MSKQKLIEEIERDIQILSKLTEDYFFIVISGTFGDHNDSLWTRYENRIDTVLSLKDFKIKVEEFNEDEYINHSIVITKDMGIFSIYNTDSYDLSEEN